MTTELSWVSRSQRVIRMVSELHRLGYQRLRIMPYVYPLAYRVQIASRDTFSAYNGAYISPTCDMNGGCSYSSASENEYFGWTDAKNDNARALAEKYIARFPLQSEQGRGHDWEYAGWLAELIGYLERGSLLPFVTADSFGTKPYSLTYFPIWDYEEAFDSGRWLKRDFPLPPPGPVEDDPAGLIGVWASNGLLAGIELAAQPGYLGSPDVVTALIAPLFDKTISRFQKEGSGDDVTAVCDSVAEAICGGRNYTIMPAWHTDNALGAAEAEYLAENVSKEFISEGLYIMPSSSMHIVSEKIDLMLSAFKTDENANWISDALPQLNHLQQFVASVLIGTNTVFFLGRTLSSFKWQIADGN